MEWTTIEKRIQAAYQLRSSYVHTGKRFDREIQSEQEERQVGSFNTVGIPKDEKEFNKALSDAPTFKGLERIMRYCLLKFLVDNKAIYIPEFPIEVVKVMTESRTHNREKKTRKVRNW